MNEIYYIYRATNVQNGKSYIGFTKDFDNRKRQHKHSAFIKQKQSHLYNAMRKYGWDNFYWELLLGSKDKDYLLNEAEPKLIEFYKTKELGYNSCDGGEGMKNPKQSTIEKIRQTATNISEETRKKRSEAAKRQWSDPVIRKRTIKGSSKDNKRKEKRQIISLKAKERWNNPEFKNRVMLSMKSVA